MKGSCTVTPGYTFTDTGAVDAAALNLAAKPAVQVDEQSIGERELIPEEVAKVLGTGASGYNYLDNGNFAENRWTRGSTPVTCAAGAKTYRADQWWCTPFGAAVTYEQAISGPNYLSLMSAKLTGATGATAVSFGQDIPRRLAAALATKLLFSFYLYNNTGATLTPSVLVNTANTADNFSAVTNVVSTAAATPAGNGSWQKYEVALDLSTVATNRGIQVVISLPSGALSSGAKTVHVAQCKLEATANATASAFVPQRETADASSAASAAPYNLFVNGQFERFANPSGSPTVSAGADTYNPEGWWVNAAGASTATLTRSSVAPSNNLSAYSARVTGGSGVNVVQFGTNVEADQAAKCRRNMTLSIWVRYHDGASTITPTLKIATPSTPNAWSGAATQISASASPCANDTWTQITYQFDGGTIPNVANGLRFILEFPSGALDAAGKYVDFAQALLEEGASASAFKPSFDRPSAPFAGASGLRCNRATTTTVTIAAAEAVLRRASYEPHFIVGPSATLDMTTSGANGLDTGTAAVGWYDVYLIHNGTGAAALACLAGATPALPSGYFAKLKVSRLYVQSIGPVVIRDYWQADSTLWNAPVNAYAGTPGTAYVTLSLATQVPPDAASVLIVYGRTDSGNLRASVAADSSGMGEATACVGDGAATFNNIRTGVRLQIPLRTAQQVAHKADTGIATRLDVLGFTV